MTTTFMKGNSKEIGNINWSGRIRQVIVLIIAIIIGMIISLAKADAKDFQRNNHKKYKKSIYRKQNNVMAHACHLLYVKRNVISNKVVKDNNVLKYR